MKWNKPEQKPTSQQNIICIIDGGKRNGTSSIIAFYNKEDNMAEDMQNGRFVYDWSKVVKWVSLWEMVNKLED